MRRTGARRLAYRVSIALRGSWRDDDYPHRDRCDRRRAAARRRIGV